MELETCDEILLKRKNYKANFIHVLYLARILKKKNSYPFKALTSKAPLKLLIMTSINSSVSFKSNSFLVFLYYQHYFSSLLKLPISLVFVNSRDIVPKYLIYYAVHSVKTVRWKKYYIIHSNEIIENLFIALWLKNIKLFMAWVHSYFEKMNLKKHRRLFLLLKLLLGKIIWNYNIFLQLKGLRLVLRGKFGKAGSVRKTRKYIRKGKCSYTSKNIGLINQTKVIRTLTGVFSIKFEVFF